MRKTLVQPKTLKFKKLSAENLCTPFSMLCFALILAFSKASSSISDNCLHETLQLTKEDQKSIYLVVTFPWGEGNEVLNQ